MADSFGGLMTQAAAMESPVPLLDNRELSIAAWLLALVLLAAMGDRPRAAMRSVVVAFLSPKVLVVFVAMAAYVGIATWGLYLIDAWDVALLSETLFWFFGPGMVLLFRWTTAAREEGFFRRTLLSLLGFTLVLEFFVNLRPFNLIAELMLVPFLFFLGATAALAASDEYRGARAILRWLIVIVTVSMLAYAIVGVASQPEQFLTLQTLFAFTLPLALTAWFIPFVYGLALVGAYEKTYSLLSWKLDDQRVARYAKWRMLRRAHVRLSMAHKFSSTFPWRLGSGATREDVDAVIDEIDPEADQRD